LEELTKDQMAENPEIRLLAVRILGIYPHPKSTSFLIQRLQDEDWKVRKEAAIGLGKQKASEAIQALSSAINDAVWDVRLSAGMALLKLGKQGRRVLELQEPDLKPNSYDVARYLLTSQGSLI
jgi:HEAT repeat protein